MVEYDVYVIFRRCQAEANNRPYRIPKNWENHLNTKMSKQNKEYLEKAARCFNTIWQNIDPERYFTYGFELFGKNFTYKNFFDKRLINLYKEKDKNLKRKINLNKQAVLKSFKFIKNFINSDNRIILRYCTRNGHVSLPIEHYIKGKIDNFSLVWLIYRGYLKITDDERVLIPNIVSNYREILGELKNIEGFMIKIESTIG